MNYSIKKDEKGTWPLLTTGTSLGAWDASVSICVLMFVLCSVAVFDFMA